MHSKHKLLMTVRQYVTIHMLYMVFIDLFLGIDLVSMV